MNKKQILGAFAMAAFALTLMTSCDKSKSQADDQAADAKVAPTETKIAFVEVDSIMTQYQFCKEYSLVLQKKGQNIQNTLAQKQQQLEAAAANFQQKLQQNAYTEQQARQIQAGLQKQQADLEALQQRLGSEMQAENEKFNTALHDSIQNFLNVYNKDKKFSLILSKAGDNILYADKAHDITKQVIAGLNKAYKKPANMSKTTEKKEEKK